MACMGTLLGLIEIKNNTYSMHLLICWNLRSYHKSSHPNYYDDYKEFKGSDFIYNNAYYY